MNGFDVYTLAQDQAGCPRSGYSVYNSEIDGGEKSKARPGVRALNHDFGKGRPGRMSIIPWAGKRSSLIVDDSVARVDYKSQKRMERQATRDHFTFGKSIWPTEPLSRQGVCDHAVCCVGAA